MCTFMVISPSVLLRMRNVSADNCREEHNIHLYTVTFFAENRVVYGTMFKNTLQPDRPQMAV